MYATDSKTAAIAALGPLFEYPDGRFQERYEEALAAATSVSEDAAEALRAFWASVAGLSTEYAEELYTRSFDLSPVCVPYVSVHVFGPENFKRAELMTGLASAYDRVGYDRGAELPDHIAVVLSGAPLFDAEEWSDLSNYVLAPALEKMRIALESANSPWRHLACAVQAMLAVGEGNNGY